MRPPLSPPVGGGQVRTERNTGQEEAPDNEPVGGGIVRTERNIIIIREIREIRCWKKISVVSF